MNIINVNNSQKELKFELYHLNLKKQNLRTYREELTKQLKFYRLNSHKIIGEQNKILGLGKIDISTKQVKHEEKVSPLCQPLPEVQLFPYDELSAKNNAQQKKFIEEYITEGLENYDFDLGSILSECELYFYIFLNKYCKFENELGGYIHNVCLLPIEMVALYLLSKENLINACEGEICYLIQNMPPENRDAFMNLIQFTKEYTIEEKTIKELMDADLLNKPVLTRKILYGTSFTPYIK